ncbi:hypothetical protein GA0070609_1660 [Micromonospora echinaurantiaca]|uniref:Uncharacterized protein n=1 Tax=Micromonospora echinaurantiaca TaxID=47857 RepID=A0A1C5HI53_9ACTN|nr:hypothetical protein [Micromonospora echinaurantiaca]SCG45654.1 hypothetical protein GA0070609_1660 [Micromonospora echinaurantiaca]
MDSRARRKVRWAAIAAAMVGLAGLAVGTVQAARVFLGQPLDVQANTADVVSMVVALIALVVGVVGVVLTGRQLRQGRPGSRESTTVPQTQIISATAPGAAAYGAMNGDVIHHQLPPRRTDEPTGPQA